MFQEKTTPKSLAIFFTFIAICHSWEFNVTIYIEVELHVIIIHLENIAQNFEGKT